MSGSPPAAKKGGHTRTGSRASQSGPSELSASGAAAPASPASAAKTGAFSRAASIAKRNSQAAPSSPSNTPNGRAPPRSNSTASVKDGLKPKRANSISMARGASSSSSSATEATYEDAASDQGELSRMSRDQLLALVTRERADREGLEARLATVTAEQSSLSTTHDDLSGQLRLQEAKLNEAYATATRFETELAGQVEAGEGLKGQIKDAEKASREAQKRYHDQVEAFEAERATWHDDQKSLQAQLAKLQEAFESAEAQAMARQASANETVASSTEASSALSPVFSAQSAPQSQLSPNFSIPASTLEELQELHTKIAQLTHEHETLTTETRRLQAEVDELQRVNGDLQEDNENFLQLLNERMFAEVIDSGIGSSADSSQSNTNFESIASDGTRSRPTSSLDALAEESEGDEDALDDHSSLAARHSRELFEASGSGSLASGAVPANIATDRVGRLLKKRDSIAGEGGLNLEAELSRANEDEEARKRAEKEQERKKAIAARRKANQSSHLAGREGDPMPVGIEALQREVRQLRQENKGLTTYVTKLVERVINVEGFERVLSADPSRASPAMAPNTSDQGPPPPTPVKTDSRPTPLRNLSTLSSATSANAGPVSPVAAAPAPKKNRMSMDWIASAFWKGSSSSASANPPAPGLKPMMLANAAAPAARRMSTEEDEEDAKTRARLQSEMKLLGLDNHGSAVLHNASPGRPLRTPSMGASPRPPSIGYASPRPPSVPPKDESALAREASMRQESESGRASGFTELSGTSPDAVKVRGHRKRPSASNRESMIGPGGLASSVGLGLSYSKDSTSTWSAGSPSAASLADGGEFVERGQTDDRAEPQPAS